MLGISVQEAMVEQQLTKCTWAGSLGLKVAAPKGNARLSRLYCPCALSPEQAEWAAHAGADPRCLLAVPRARRFSSGGEEDDFDRSMHKVSRPPR